VFRILLRLTAVCGLVVVGGGSSAAAWDTTAGNDTNYGSITFGGTETDYSYGVAVDGSGNVYHTGAFEDTVDFGAGNVTSNGSLDVFVTKHNSAGVHQWTTTFGGTGNDIGRGVGVDGSGNVYTSGYFVGTVDFGAGNVTSSGSYDVFVTKLNAAGVHQWTNTFGGTGNDIGRGGGGGWFRQRVHQRLLRRHSLIPGPVMSPPTAAGMGLSPKYHAARRPSVDHPSFGGPRPLRTIAMGLVGRLVPATWSSPGLPSEEHSRISGAGEPLSSRPAYPSHVVLVTKFGTFSWESHFWGTYPTFLGRQPEWNSNPGLFRRA
jgi:Beta-propeller repeat.